MSSTLCLEEPPQLVMSTPESTPLRQNGPGVVIKETPVKYHHQFGTTQQDDSSILLLGLALAVRTLTMPTLSGRLRLWLVLVGIAAFFDFAATVLVEYLPAEEERVVGRRFLFFRKQEIIPLNKEHWFVEFLRWLDDYSVHIGILFSILWFTDAFVKASWRRDETLLELDRQRLLEGDVAKSEDEAEYEEWKGAWRPYYLTILTQLVLLPVGFYLLAWHVLRVLAGDAEEDDDEEIDFVFMDEEGNVEEEQRFTTRSNLSLCFAMIQYIAASLLRITGTSLKARMRAFQWRTIRRLLRSAIRHPRTFRRRVLNFLTFVRWFTYLAPLLGACNKLLGNVGDLLKKRTQYIAAVKAKHARRLMWKKLTPDERRKAAAIVIQSEWRAHKARKRLRLVRTIKGEKEALAATRVQRIARGMLSRARARLMKKRYELRRLQKQEIAIRNDTSTEQTHISVEERRRMYKLQEELKLVANDLVNRRLLLRPNTNFSVTWKVLFVICIILEIAQLAWKPKLSKFRDPETKQPMALGEVLEQKLVPTPLSEWEECEIWLQEPPRDRRSRRKWKQKREKGGLQPWYCQEPYVTSQWAYNEILRFLLTETLAVVGIVCYLDVFITFFTGEIDATGTLVPKPAFARWILPGLILQLAVNPVMEATSHFVGALINRIVELGPVRVYRWSAALFFPLFRVTVNCIEQYVWLPLVYKQNKALQMYKNKKLF